MYLIYRWFFLLLWLIWSIIIPISVEIIWTIAIILISYLALTTAYNLLITTTDILMVLNLWWIIYDFILWVIHEMINRNNFRYTWFSILGIVINMALKLIMRIILMVSTISILLLTHFYKAKMLNANMLKC